MSCSIVDIYGDRSSADQIAVSWIVGRAERMEKSSNLIVGGGNYLGDIEDLVASLTDKSSYWERRSLIYWVNVNGSTIFTSSNPRSGAIQSLYAPDFQLFPDKLKKEFMLGTLNALHADSQAMIHYGESK